ncbi:AfsR/SARP family transcriptional regulator [Mesorhizobium helmanticense]|uniref:AfsR/SARP family transcriptional regulator n=1 Tax=Mesorhizobium helmanticense TaxID=1776423 RepID=UPI00142E91C2|nr:BTAD domain-containing putative transcriptional regulator [Mesorhizobium helmanticense]
MGGKIKLLGEPAILDAAGQSQPVRGHQAWALLARLALARAPLDRRSLAAELFPETVDPLGSLRWCLASLRKALNASECLNGDPVECRFAADIEVDVWNLDRDDFDVEQAGPLLGSLEPRCSPEFSTWLLVERERIAGIVEARIRQETIRAMSIEDHGRATRLAELGVRRSPYDEGAHILLVKSLALAGRYDAALGQVEAAEAVFLAELGEKPSAALRSAARRTIASPPGGISPEAFVRSLMQSGLAALSAGAADAGIDCLRRAVRDAEKTNDPHLTATATFELGTALVHSVRGYDDEGSILLRQSTELARRSGSAGVASAGFRELGYVEALAGRRPTAAAYLAQAVELAEDSDALAGIHGVIGFNLVDWGRIEEGLDNYALSLEHARSAGNRRREIWSLGLGGWGLLAADRLPEADSWLGDCLALVEEQRWISFRPWPVAVLSESRTRQQASPRELRPGLEEAFALSCQMNDPCWEGAVARALALTYAAHDALPEAMEWLGEAHRRCGRDTDAYSALQVEILASQVEISSRQGRPEVADAIGREWLALAARTHRDAHVARAAAFIGGRR